MEIQERLLACKHKVESIQSSILNTENSLREISDIIEDTDHSLSEVILAQQYYKKAVDIVYERSIQELKDVLNSALHYVFTDRNFDIDIILTDTRGKALKFIIRDNDREVNLRRGMGMGVKCVISAILHIYYLQCKNSKVLMLDEAYSNISEEYIGSFFEFLSKLCHRLQFTIILITHDKRFIPYANRVYNISKGNVTLEVS